MSAARRVVFFTVPTWLPVLCFFYIPNAIWGIALKALAAIFLVSLIYDFTVGRGSHLYGSAGAGFILNAIWFTIINLCPPQWVRFILWALIIIGIGTCYKILKRLEDDPSYNGMNLYDK